MNTETITQAQRETAAAHIHAEELYDGTWRYYDDATQVRYIAPASDLDRLYELLHSDHEDERRDAYSLWCAECSHAIEGEDEDEDEDDD